MKSFVSYIVFLFALLIVAMSASAVPARYFIRTFDATDGGYPSGGMTTQCNHCGGRSTGADGKDGGADSLNMAGISGVSIRVCANNGNLVSGAIRVYSFDPDTDGGYLLSDGGTITSVKGCTSVPNACYAHNADLDKTITAQPGPCQQFSDNAAYVQFGGLAAVPVAIVSEDGGTKVNVKIWGCFSPTGAGCQ